MHIRVNRSFLCTTLLSSDALFTYCLFLYQWIVGAWCFMSNIAFLAWCVCVCVCSDWWSCGEVRVWDCQAVLWACAHSRWTTSPLAGDDRSHLVGAWWRRASLWDILSNNCERGRDCNLASQWGHPLTFSWVRNLVCPTHVNGIPLAGEPSHCIMGMWIMFPVKEEKAHCVVGTSILFALHLLWLLVYFHITVMKFSVCQCNGRNDVIMSGQYYEWCNICAMNDVMIP